MSATLTARERTQVDALVQASSMLDRLPPLLGPTVYNAAVIDALATLRTHTEVRLREVLSISVDHPRGRGSRLVSTARLVLEGVPADFGDDW